jgi:hypothetical protein
VALTPDGHALVLGAGEAPTPVVPRVQPATPAIPDGIDDPAIAEAWHHAEDLAALGLPGRAADQLVAISRLSRDAQADMLLRAGELYAAADKQALAAAQFTAAAARPDLADRALAGAIQGHRVLREFSAAAALAEARAALPGLSATARAEADADAVALRRAATLGPALALRFDRPLDPGWRIHDPLAVARDPGTGSLSLRTSSDRVLAELPLAWDGGSVELSVDLALDHLDWGTRLEVSVSPPDLDDSWLALTLRSGGSTARPSLGASATWGPKSETWGLQHELPSGYTGRVRLHFRHDVELGLALAEITPAGAPGVRKALSEAPRAPPRGPLRLRLTSRTVEPQLVGQIRVHAIDLTGFRPGPWPTPADPDADTARLIAEGELGSALVRLAAPGDDVRALWRAHLLARLGRHDAAAEALTVALRGVFDLTPTAPPRARLDQLFLHDPDELHGVARRVLGPALDEIYVTPLLNRVPMRPGLVRHRLTDLDPHPLAPPADRDPLGDRRHCDGLIVRGAAWRAAGRGDLAGAPTRASRLSWAPTPGPSWLNPPDRWYALRAMSGRAPRPRPPKRRPRSALRRRLPGRRPPRPTRRPSSTGSSSASEARDHLLRLPQPGRPGRAVPVLPLHRRVRDQGAPQPDLPDPAAQAQVERHPHRDLQVDGTRFAAGTPMAFKYDFGFYRFGYMYDLLKHPEQELGIGLALQIRNATIDFASRDGELLATNRNIGVVPLLKLRGRWTPRAARASGSAPRSTARTSAARSSAAPATTSRAPSSTPRCAPASRSRAPATSSSTSATSAAAPAAPTAPRSDGTDGFAENWLHTMALSLGLYIR